MKVGIRMPSVKKSVKARTTGRIKREVKSSYNPLYGKKGMGYLKDPERAVKNKIYHKLTVDPLAPLKRKGKKEKTTPQYYGPSKACYIMAALSVITELYFIVSLFLDRPSILVLALGIVFGLIYLVWDR